MASRVNSGRWEVDRHDICYFQLMPTKEGEWTFSFASLSSPSGCRWTSQGWMSHDENVAIAVLLLSCVQLFAPHGLQHARLPHIEYI